VADPLWSITVKNSLVTNKTDPINVVKWYLWANPTVNKSPPEQLPYLVTSMNQSILQWTTTTTWLGNNPSKGYMTISTPHGYICLEIDYMGTIFGRAQSWCVAWGATQPNPDDAATYPPPGFTIPVKSPGTEWIMPAETGYQIIIDTQAAELGLQVTINIRDPK
jgi:hypothetical protein